ncbi:aminodeoxychorismate lyase [Cellvibrio japonicus]|uniref:Aminodeoxychorismate lyase n=1 Tax=Cellvibrio japonicus (strain Ueda107) TaxID=498211 RepID=B3PEV4_CELJU|nr:aminodeoxychorismate lyase [Cellvibrio japonicus]ACE85655.1 4-amino-4-deoxychorismate lyase [Cellvibrio japonicus Ueda107]QEI12201.1 aminodeoxychorismate lyase [Cellvibrio japonicus]QEI15775.1 aminodeoxychorismate lyase [Cellvibrio japonicus]QEI19353.1 aminodeoxychorismate lyase [Cellvibrio japonicus]
MPANFPLISVNGQIGGSISPLDRGFAYGDGVFETCRLCYGHIPLWDFHYRRLSNSCQQLRIPLDERKLLGFMHSLLSRDDVVSLADAVFKLVVTRGVAQDPEARGYRIPASSHTTYCLSISPAKPLLSAQYQHGIRVRICRQRLADSVLAGLKHLNRLEQVLARSEWTDEYDEGLLLDLRGNLIEATAANIFIRRDGQWFTPDLSSTGVAGVMRDFLLTTLMPTLGEPVRIMPLGLNKLAMADEVFLCNSMIGIWPVCLADTANLSWQVGAGTRQLQSAYEAWLQAFANIKQ